MIRRTIASVITFLLTAGVANAGDAPTMPALQAPALSPPPPDQQQPQARVVYAPYRYDDILWENDRTAHRIYGPALQRYEPPAGSGIDAWGKHVPWPFMERQLATGKQHDYHGEGVDFFHVGGTRGIGGLGVWYDNKLWVSRDWHDYRIIHRGPDRAEFEVNYAPWPVDVIRRVWEKRHFSLPLGTNFTRITSTLSSSTRAPLTIGIGISKHPTSEAKGHFVADRAHGRFSFWSPEDPDNGAMGDALIINPALITGVTEDADHYLVLVTIRPGQPFVYYLGATWSKAGHYRDAAAWEAGVAKERVDFKAR